MARPRFQRIDLESVLNFGKRNKNKLNNQKVTKKVTKTKETKTKVSKKSISNSTIISTKTNTKKIINGNQQQLNINGEEYSLLAKGCNHLNGSANLIMGVGGGRTLRLTKSLKNERGSLFSNKLISIDDCDGIQIDFTYEIINKNADGFAFVIQRNSIKELGEGGGGLGYQGIGNGVLVVEFDNFSNPELGDPSVDHVSIMIPDKSKKNLLSAHHNYSIGMISPSNFASNGKKNCKIIINNANSTCSIYLITDNEKLENVKIPFKLPSDFYIGFTGGTGYYSQEVLIHSCIYKGLPKGMIHETHGNINQEIIQNNSNNVLEVCNEKSISLFSNCILNGSALHNSKSREIENNNNNNNNSIEDSKATSFVILTDSYTKISMGSIFSKQLIPIGMVNEGFEIEFTFKTIGRGDGFAFVIQNEGSNALGDPDAGGGGLGYHGIKKGVLSIEFDYYRNTIYGDCYSDHISIHRPSENGSLTCNHRYQLGILPSQILNSKSENEFKIIYNKNQSTISIYLKNNSKVDKLENVKIPFKLPSAAFIGFTAANGDLTQANIIYNCQINLN